MKGAPVELVWLYRHDTHDVVRTRADADDVKGNLILMDRGTAALLAPAPGVAGKTTQERNDGRTDT